MNIDHVSDIHVNHWMLWTPNQLKWEKKVRAFTKELLKHGTGEVLIIAGDFSEYNSASLWLLDEAAKYYERVYYTFGNHDLYLNTTNQLRKYGDSRARVEELIAKAKDIPNVVPLIKNIDTYKGITFAGDAMWYFPHTEEDWAFFHERSNDSSCITLKGLSPKAATLQLNKESIEWYNTLDGVHVDVFVSHVPPIRNPFSPFEANGCYITNPDFLVAKHWICGHEHIQRTFERIGVTFHMNAIGYPNHWSKYPMNSNQIPNENSDEYKSFGVKTFTV